MAPADPQKHKPRHNHKPYVHVMKPKVKDLPKTSALPQPPAHARHNLTLSDWLTVVRYYDDNQPISQEDVVKHFKNLPQGALIFTQSLLSRHITAKGRSNDQARLSSNPTALSGKRARIVTRPDVEKALVLWVGHMEQKRETVTGPMLMAKRAKFEEAMDIPEDERLKSGGWVQNFLRT
jgi:Tc5 transposase DNA-binding domain